MRLIQILNIAKTLSSNSQIKHMGLVKRILKWIIIWTAILFVPILLLGILATIGVAVGLGAIASGETMIGLSILFFFSPPVLTAWGLGVIIIILGNLFNRQRRKRG